MNSRKPEGGSEQEKLEKARGIDRERSTKDELHLIHRWVQTYSPDSLRHGFVTGVEREDGILDR